MDLWLLWWRIRRFFRRLFRDRSTRIREFGPFVADWSGGAFLQVNAFYRVYDLWVGGYYDRKDTALYLCVLGFGVKLKTIYRERSR